MGGQIPKIPVALACCPTLSADHNVPSRLRVSPGRGGLAKAGNEIGLTEREIELLPADEFERRLSRAYTRMQRAGADYVIDGIWDLLPCLDDIEARLARGERPQHG